MTTFLKVQDQIQEASKGEIQKKRFSPVLGIVFILVALPILWFAGHEASLGNDTVYILSVGGIILGLAGLTVLLLPREYFVLATARGTIRPHTVNLESIEKEHILQLFENGQLKEILKLSTKNPSSLSIELWEKDGYKNVFAQIYQNMDSGRQPISAMKVFTIDDVRR